MESGEVQHGAGEEGNQHHEVDKQEGGHLEVGQQEGGQQKGGLVPGGGSAGQGSEPGGEYTGKAFSSCLVAHQSSLASWCLWLGPYHVLQKVLKRTTWCILLCRPSVHSTQHMAAPSYLDVTVWGPSRT